ncbi:uncharacterized protein A1O5_07358 [Cladophialophora psammophila CBS 110553]|uniref:C2H2-type domain-containing protein n=1 Tax=Cladophialophora psammophila CBS 110553 TaxID=1182543 RepID=W9WMD1_9EURO|nr:uncharacterized protein A1O5_07358 [Cladophialophora psammophila CBS 110553]EXJ69322.1 hypothetical protein A1O5_07358 [Cladophialophora psammophila CBS 110553]
MSYSTVPDESTYDSRIQRPLLQAPEKVRQCPHCSREFKKNDHYDRHVRSHTNEKPYGCRTCGKFYPRRDTLLRHFKTHEVTRGKQRAARIAISEAHPDASPPAALEQAAHASSIALPPKPTLRSNLPPADTVVDTTAPNDHDGSMVVRPPFAGFQHEMIINPNVSIADSGSQPLGHWFGDELAQMSVPSSSTDQRASFDAFPGHQLTSIESSVLDGFALNDPLLQFDATNWLLDEDFVDIENVGSSLYEARPLSGQPHLKPAPLSSTRGSDRPPSVLDLRRMWFLQVRSHIGVETEVQAVSTERSDIDENYHTQMVEELRTPLPNEPLPSVDLLNLCIHFFFTRFNVALPLIHGPTFRPSASSTMFVLLICAAGAMTMTSDAATRIGARLFERVIRTGAVVPWERRLLQHPHLMRDNIRGAAIGQTFALLSGDPAHRTIADAYHGTLISLARSVSLFTETPEFGPNEMVLGDDLERVWKRWARCEEMRRAVVILHIQDAEITALFHHEPTFRHNVSRLPPLAPAELFQAPTATIWAMKYRTWRRSWQDQASVALGEDTNHLSMLNSWAVLSGIGATICESRHLKLLSAERITEFQADLLMWYSSPQNCCQKKECRSQRQPELPFCLRPLWHHTFMVLTTDFNALELAVGRQGTDIDASTLNHVRTWICSPESKRCLLHAMCLQNMVASTTVGSADAVHTARILFSAALCWYCYMLYLPWCSASVGSDAHLLTDKTSEYLMTLPEIRLLRENRSVIETRPGILDQAIADLKAILVANTAVMKASTLCVLESTLRRLGTSGISRKFADVVQAFVSGQTE